MENEKMNREQQRAERERITTLLAYGDPFEYFEKRSITIGQRIGISADSIREAVDILKGAFGAEWLIAQAQKKGCGEIAPFCDHPLGTVFDVAGEPQITTACEIALYLKVLARTPRLTTVLANLKNPADYNTSLMQLAFAFRLERIGAEKIEFEPPVADGRVGDIGFRLHGAEYVAECYLPRTTPRLYDGVGDLRTAFASFMDAISGEDSLHRILMIRPKHIVTPKGRKGIAAYVRQLSNEIGDQVYLKWEDESVLVELRRLPTSELSGYFPRDNGGQSPEFYDGAQAFIYSHRSSEEELLEYRDSGIKPPNSQIRNLILIWDAPRVDAPPTLNEWMAELVGKISRKLAQARRDDQPRRLVIVGLHEASEDNEDVPEALRTLCERLEGGHENYAGALIVSRVMWPNFRHGYVGYVGAGNPENSLPTEVVLAFGKLEARRDILTA
jgi:hypothetical protein